MSSTTNIVTTSRDIETQSSELKLRLFDPKLMSSSVNMITKVEHSFCDIASDDHQNPTLNIATQSQTLIGRYHNKSQTLILRYCNPKLMGLITNIVTQSYEFNYQHDDKSQTLILWYWNSKFMSSSINIVIESIIKIKSLTFNIVTQSWWV